MHPKVDAFFGITMEEILADREGVKPVSDAKRKEVWAELERQKTDTLW